MRPAWWFSLVLHCLLYYKAWFLANPCSSAPLFRAESSKADGPLLANIGINGSCRKSISTELRAAVCDLTYITALIRRRQDRQSSVATPLNAAMLYCRSRGRHGSFMPAGLEARPRSGGWAPTTTGQIRCWAI